ncbi:MAG: hypothetical protein ABSB36_04750 [Candidatus Dormibacteria bacterium]
MLRHLPVALLALAMTACAGTVPHASATPTPSHPPTPTPVATASPSSAPDTEQVTVTASGVGAYDLQAYPVAVLHNQASAHIATGVVVSFTVHFPGGTYALTAEPVSLASGESLAVTALCTDSCARATSAAVSFTVGGWQSGDRAIMTATAATYACGSPCAGTTGYEGDVSATLSGQVPSGTLLSLSAACEDSTGTIVGGGLTATVWPGGASAASSVPVLVSATPASCQLYATEIS